MLLELGKILVYCRDLICLALNRVLLCRVIHFLTGAGKSFAFGRLGKMGGCEIIKAGSPRAAKCGRYRDTGLGTGAARTGRGYRVWIDEVRGNTPGTEAGGTG